MKALQTLPPGIGRFTGWICKRIKDGLVCQWAGAPNRGGDGGWDEPAGSISSLFQMDGGPLLYGLRFVSLFVLIFGYLILHELVHGITMKACGTKKVRYGFTGLYCYAGSEDYYGKKSYLIIALAPVVLFFFLLIPINLIVPREWFWVVYFLQIGNLSGAAGICSSPLNLPVCRKISWSRTAASAWPFTAGAGRRIRPEMPCRLYAPRGDTDPCYHLALLYNQSIYRRKPR